MFINRKKESVFPFFKVKAGRVFEFEGDLYMKIEAEMVNNEANAIMLSNGFPALINEQASVVIKRTTLNVE